MKRPLNTVWRMEILWPRGNYITGTFNVRGLNPKDWYCSVTPGDGGRIIVLLYVCGSLLYKGLALQPLFQPQRPTAACMSAWRQEVTTLQGTAIQPQKPHKKQRKWLRDWIRVYHGDRITIVYTDWGLYNTYRECVCPCHKVQTAINLTTFWCSYKQSEYLYTYIKLDSIYKTDPAINNCHQVYYHKSGSGLV